SRRARAQGASERNTWAASADAAATRALRAAPAAFWLWPPTVSVGLIGPGNVGRALLAQLAAALPRLQARGGLDLRVRAIADSRRMLRVNPGLAAAELGADGVGPRLRGTGSEPVDLDALAAHVRAEHLPHALIIDCSASDAVAARYPEWLAAGIHVVTPNK